MFEADGIAVVKYATFHKTELFAMANIKEMLKLM